jgi:hypothetical protein
MLLLVLKFLVVYLVFGMVYSTNRFRKEYKRAYWMLNYTNVKRPKLELTKRYLANIIAWLPKLIMEMFNYD